jgi:decaprenylphospho-beta-D-ribofuranose 2-oxidase
VLRKLRSRNNNQEIPASNGERLLTGWGKTSPTRASVVSPTDDNTIVQLMSSRPHRGLIARGLGRSYGDPAQNAGGTVIDMTELNGVRAFNVDEATITVDAGLSLERLASMIIPFGFFLPVTPGTQFVTVGGAIACDIHGKNHHVDGSFGEHVASFVLLTPRGDVLDVSPQEQPELFWATAGGMGLTGIILSATIRLPRISTSMFIVDIDRTANLDEVMALQSAEDDRYRYSVAWIDCMARGGSMGRSILMRGNHATPDHLPPADRQRALVRKPDPMIAAPPWMPTGLLRTSTVRVLNEAWYRKAPAHQHEALQSITKFFYPLDVISEWNRFYGASGFLQYQFVVPDSAASVVQTIIETLSGGGWPTSLAVLKRMGASRGPLSFAVEGWTLAVDIPAGLDDLGALLDGFDELVANAGGRVYLAKDSRMRPELVPAMYPELSSWRRTVARIDPDQLMQSDLARRLQLRTKE